MRRILFSIFTFFAINSSFGQLLSFTLTNAADGKSVSLGDFKDSKGLVIIFLSTSCPYDGYYDGRIATFVKEKGNDVSIVLVNPNPTETPEAMKAKLVALNIQIPYLIDKDQSLMMSLGATKTPEVFVLKNDGGKFMTHYFGAIDDNPQMATEVTQHYLKDAVSGMLTGSSKKPDTRPVGCSIRKK